MAQQTVDDLKMQLDGHLEYGKVQSKDHAWVRPVFPTAAYCLDPEGAVVGELRGMPGYGHVGYGKDTTWLVTPEQYNALVERGLIPNGYTHETPSA